MKASDFFALPASLLRFAPFFPADIAPWLWLKKIGPALESAEFDSNERVILAQPEPREFRDCSRLRRRR